MPHHKRNRPKHQRAGSTSKGKQPKDERYPKTERVSGGNARREMAATADVVDEEYRKLISDVEASAMAGGAK